MKKGRTSPLSQFDRIFWASPLIRWPLLMPMMAGWLHLLRSTLDSLVLLPFVSDFIGIRWCAYCQVDDNNNDANLFFHQFCCTFSLSCSACALRFSVLLLVSMSHCMLCLLAGFTVLVYCPLFSLIFPRLPHLLFSSVVTRAHPSVGVEIGYI